MRTLGEQARAFRVAKDWNTTQMAAAVKTSRQNIESLEAHGNRIPKYIGALARLMGRTVDDMLSEAGMAETPPQIPAAWPFTRVTFERFQALSDADKAYVEGKLAAAIEECERASQEGVLPAPAAPAPLTEADRRRAFSSDKPLTAPLGVPHSTPAGRGR